MTSALGKILLFSWNSRKMFSVLLILFTLCGLAFLLIKEWVFLALPFIVLIILWGIQDFRRLYLLMWATIPFSIELDLPGGLSTDFPAEPLMWMSCLLLIGYLFLYQKTIDFRFIFHPLFVILLGHFSWIIITSILS